MAPLWPLSWSFQRPHHVYVFTARVFLCVSAASCVLSHQLSVEGTLQGSPQNPQNLLTALTLSSLGILATASILYGSGYKPSLCFWPDVPDMVSLYQCRVCPLLIVQLYSSLSLSRHLCRNLSSFPWWSAFASSVVSPLHILPCRHARWVVHLICPMLDGVFSWRSLTPHLFQIGVFSSLSSEWRVEGS